MPQTGQTNGKREGNKKRFYRSWGFWIVLGALLLLGALVRWGWAFDTLTARYAFLAQSILALFTLTAIAIQARIYWAQRDVMERQWKAMTDQLDAINPTNSPRAIPANTATRSCDEVFIAPP